MKKLASLLFAIVSLCAIPSCNTFIGMGQDIQSLGKGMENKGHGQTWDGRAPAPSTAPSTVAPQ
ncbi:MAG: hypothetical protein ACPG32_16015 [Akkermansiaceae bacterium]